MTWEDPETASWRMQIINEMGRHGETWGHLEAITIDDGELDRKFYFGFGADLGARFTAWTAARVYFPVVYDGKQWVGSVPRHPCQEKSAHKGGGAE